MAVPPVVHDKCDVQLLDEFVVCQMNGEILECALSNCTGDKFKCDCNVYGYAFEFSSLVKTMIKHFQEICSFFRRISMPLGEN